jgi:CheY-like chemotaxis protein
MECPVPSDAAPEERPATSAPADALRPLRILVVDDEPGILELLQEMLTMDGHTVETVDDARDVLARVATTPFDVIISDLRMPGMSGGTLHRALEAAHPQLARRMVFMTGDASGEDVEEFLAEVHAPTVAKPFTRAGLVDALRAALEV